MKKIGKRITSLCFALILAVTMMVTVFPDAAHAAGNQAVNDASTGVLQVNLIYRDDNNSYNVIGYGSAFLINSNTIVTCAHVVNLTDSEIEATIEYYDLNKSVVEFKDRLSYSVTVTRDVTISASIAKMSVDMDFAIMTLQQSIQNKTPLTIAKSSEVSATDTVYAIGFPDESAQVEAVPTYTSDDVTITSGSVNKVTIGTNLYSGENTDYIQTSVNLLDGNSGGPMVNEDGNVIGVCEGATGDERSDHYFYAVAIDQVTEVLDSLGIQYTKAIPDGPDPNPVIISSESEEVIDPIETVDKSSLSGLIAENEGKSEKEYSEESFAAYSEALANAKTVNNNQNATQEEVDAAKTALSSAVLGLTAKSGPNVMMIAIIAAIVVVIIIIIILLVVLGGKKKKQKPVQATPVNVMPNIGVSQPPQQSYQRSFTPSPMTDSMDIGETTVLNNGNAGETTLLSKNVNGGVLLRKNGERININAEEFIIGREKTKVNYCVSNNSTVGRTHAKIVIRNGIAYLVDLKAQNGTYVNGVKCQPMQEVVLKNGDKVALSDEEFIYQA